MTVLPDGMTVKELNLSHPEDAIWIEFDEANENHIARHGVLAEEVWQVFEDDPLWAKNKRNMTAAWLMIGRTYGGRPLVIFVTYDEGRECIRPVTARTCKPEEVARWSV